jgi:hypothetical protein
MAAHIQAVAPGELDDRIGVGKAELSSLELHGRPFQLAFRHDDLTELRHRLAIVSIISQRISADRGTEHRTGTIRVPSPELAGVRWADARIA